MNINIKKLYKSYDKETVLENISMKINSGEIICLLGPSGSGKTTLIRCILGAIPINSGRITINKVEIPNLEILNNIGYMPQNDALYEDLTGKQNMRFFAGISKNNIDFNTREKEIFEILELNDSKNKIVSKYSGGMKKRLSLAIALYSDPNILILDEPTVGIDPILRKKIWNNLRELKSKGKIIIVTTHVMDELKECDKAALIYNHKLIEYDTIDNLLNKTPNRKIEELFLKAGGVK